MNLQDSTYFNTKPCFSARGEIAVAPDEATGAMILKNISIVEVGEAKGHDVFLDESFVADVVRMGNASTDGIKSRFDHQTHCFTTMGWTLGTYKNFRLSEDGTKAIADLHLLKSADLSPHGKIGTYIQELATEAPTLFGNSIEFERGDTYFRTEKSIKVKPLGKGYVTSDNIVYDAETHGAIDDSKVYATIVSLRAGDLVDSPAATSGLFATALGFLGINFGNTRKVAEVRNFLKTLSQTGEESPTKKPISKNLHPKLQAKFSDMNTQKYDIGAKSGETTVIVTTANSMIAVGDMVTDETGAALPDGDYPLTESDDGQNVTISVVGGQIVNIAPTTAEMQQEEMAAQQTEVPAQVAELSAQVRSLFSEVQALGSQLAAMAIENTDLKAQIEKLSNKPADIKATVTKTSSAQKPEIYSWLPRN